ncbi:MHYT domain-containing protein [Vibrio pectenicida]|uniref:MHYT domain-containing protein n=1 Tax=Vibrio pectenicida TaxID=62763 RepID=UPI003B9A04FC
MTNLWRFKAIDPTLYTEVQADFNLYLVLLSIFVSSLAAYASLIVLKRIWYSDSPKIATLWKFFGAAIYGLGVWAMHFTGMLAYMIPMPMTYSIPITISSLLPPIVGALVAFHILQTRKFSLIDMQLSALSLALGIGSMHFLGMEAMQSNATMVYNLPLFLTSLIVAFACAFVAILLIKTQRNNDKKPLYRGFLNRTLASAVMGVAIAGMHYTAMLAVKFYVEKSFIEPSIHSMADTHFIAFSVTIFIVIIFVATAFTSMIDIRLQSAESSVQASIKRERQIINSLADGLIIIDGENKVESINKMGIQIFGYEGDEIKGVPVEILMPSFDKQSVEETSALDHELRSGLMFKGKKKNNQLFPIEVSLSVLAGVNEDSKYFSCVVRDITSRLEQEKVIRQSQKLESMGQLAAGIAHEINTPTQYVSDNTNFLKSSFGTFLNIVTELKQVDQTHPTAQPKQEAINLNKLLEKHDFDFIAEEIPLAIDQSLEGLNRISKIVHAMKSFTHSGHGEVQQVDILEAIESTITIARSEWRYVANVETDFAPSTPKIPCRRDEFNQVILNFIINAAHAIEEKYKGQDSQLGSIKISVFPETHYVIIKIEDNGIGIPDNIIDNIFDPFFTTKDVGKGTGQGLNLAYSCIVEHHKGVIHTETQVGQGTTFTIKLPISVSRAQIRMEHHDEHPVS